MDILLPLPFIIPMLAMGIAVAIAIYSVVMKDKIEDKDSLGKNLLRVYLYVITLFSLIITTMSFAVVLNAALASKFGVEFSYTLNKPSPKVDAIPYTLKENFPEKEKRCYDDQEEITINEQNVCVDKDVIRKDIVKGLSIALPMTLILVLHIIGIITIEKKHVVLWIKKGYRFISLILFSVVGIISTSMAIKELVEFFYLKAEDITQQSKPGPSLAIALVVLPLWVYFLISTNKLKDIKKNKKEA